MQKDQLFIDLAHIAYAGHVPKEKLDEIAGKPSWENDSSVHADDFPQEPLTKDLDLLIHDEEQ